MKLFKTISIVLLTLTLFTLATAPVAAQEVDTYLDVVEKESGYGGTQLMPTVGRIIETVLGFLGLIALILFIVGGFKWMTSGGNEENVSEAKKLMSAAIVGLLIIFIAFAATRFIISKLESATGTAACETNQLKCTYAGTGGTSDLSQYIKCVDKKWSSKIYNCAGDTTCTVGETGATIADICE